MSALTHTAEADELVLRSGRGRIALVATVAASAMASLDATVVNVALPHIGEEFHATVSALQWVLTGYLVALAPLILLVGGPGWGWAFLINVPVAAIAIVCAPLAIPETRDPGAGRSLDLVGASMAVVGLATSTWALTEAGPRGWTDSAVLGVGALAVIAIGAFVWRMLHTSDPLVPPALFRDRTFTVVNLQTVLLYGGLGVSFFLVSYELQVATGWSALKAGVALLPATALMLALSASSGSLAQRIGPRLQLPA